MINFPQIFNACEIVLWGSIGLTLLVAASRRRDEKLYLALAGVLFLAFGASDAVELLTGAWWRPWWLLTWKAICILGLMSLWILQYRNKS